MKGVSVSRIYLIVAVLSLVIIEHIDTFRHRNIFDSTISSDKRVHYIIQHSRNQITTSVSIASTTASEVGSDLLMNLQSMKVTELKALLKRLGGGSPGGLRKSEMVEACSKFLLTNYSTQLIKAYSTGFSSAAPAVVKSDSFPPSKPRLVMQPIVDRNNSINIIYNSKNAASVNITDMKIKQVPTFAEADYNKQENNSKRFKYTSDRRESRFEDDEINCEMDLTFLGTASCIPTITRGVSCLAMRYQSDVWLFDCGESSQVQIQKSRVKPSKVTKIFITHTHGDHSFGLPGVLCLIGQSRLADTASQALDDPSAIVDIYGPEGIRDFIRGVVQMTYSRIVVPHRIHELKQVPFLHQKYQREPAAAVVRTRFDPNYGEREGSRDIYPDANGHYTLLDDDLFVVQAAPMQHTIPCVGYVVTEKDRAGSMRVDLLKDVVESNKKELISVPELVKSQARTYLKIYAYLKELRPGQSFVFPDGRKVCPEEYMEPPKRGRKLVYMGDTCSGVMIAPLAMDADVLMHEATNAFLSDDSNRHTSYSSLERETRMHGHSTPQMAGMIVVSLHLSSHNVKCLLHDTLLVATVTCCRSICKVDSSQAPDHASLLSSLSW